MKKSQSRSPIRPAYDRLKSLTQADIDGPQPHPDSRPWWDNSPGPWLSVIVFLFFLACCYGLFSLWGMAEIYRAATAVRG